MGVTLKPDLQTRSCTNTIMVSYRSQKFLDQLHQFNMRVSPDSLTFRVRVWLRETKLYPLVTHGVVTYTLPVEAFATAVKFLIGKKCA